MNFEKVLIEISDDEEKMNKNTENLNIEPMIETKQLTSEKKKENPRKNKKKRQSYEKYIEGLSADKYDLYLELTGKRKKEENGHFEVPAAPELQTAKRSLTKSKPTMPKSEEKEMSEIKAKREELRSQLKRNQDLYKKALDSKGFEEVIHQPPTQATGLCLRTEQRKAIREEYMRQKAERTRAREEQEHLLDEEKKRSVIKEPVLKLQVTKPEPFDLASEKRARLGKEPVEEFTSLQEKVNNFYSRKDSPRQYSQERLENTKPVSPDFELKRRLSRRKTELLSTEEQELAEIKKHAQFKALPLNTKIFHSEYALGVRYVDPRPTTQFEEFNLATEKRPRSNKKQQEQTSKELNKPRFNPEILKMPDFVPQKLNFPVTNPIPFEFQTTKRCEIRRGSVEENSSLNYEFRAKPMPIYPEKPFPDREQPRKTSIIEFNLSTEKRKQSKETPRNSSPQPAAFKALPMPKFENILEIKREVKVTVPKTFSFATDERIRGSTMESEPNFQFHAQPIMDYDKQRLEIKSSAREPTKAVGISLQSEKRALQRLEFDKENSKIAENKAKEIQIQKLEKEKQEMQALRKTLGFRATPILKGNPIIIDHKEHQITKPQCFDFSTEKRSLQRQQSLALIQSKKDDLS